MKEGILLITACLLVGTLGIRHTKRDDMLYTVTQLIQERGYPVETHSVTTEDGFILGIQRIPFGKSGKPTRGVVMMQHGLLDTAATWVINDAQQSLGFLLADQGYDVWLCNSRGNQYSLANTALSPDQPEFWNWNWDQHAKYDIPASVDYVIGVTNVSQVNWVAHSQGATISIAGFSTIPALAQKIKIFFALAPVTYMTAQKSVLLSTLATLHADLALKVLGNGPFKPTPSFLASLLGNACNFTPLLCSDVLSSLFGPAVALNNSRMGVYLAHWPDTTSSQNMIHWLQNTRSGNFAAMNNGPEYLPAAVGCPVVLFAGSNDFLADTEDMLTLANGFNQGGWLKQFQTSDFSHMDFVWSYLAPTTVYEPLIAVLNQYN